MKPRMNSRKYPNMRTDFFFKRIISVEFLLMLKAFGIDANKFAKK